MPRNGSGTYTAPANTVNPAVAGQVIDASDFNDFTADVETALTNSIASNGETTITANLPMSGYVHTGVGNATARTHYLATGQFQDAGPIYAAASSSATAWAVTLSPAITSYTAGQRFFVKAAVANSSALTVNFNSLGAKSVKKFHNQALVSGDIEAGQICELAYDGTNFQLLSAVANPYSDPLTTLGDMVIRSSSATTRLAIGTTGYVPVSDGTTFAWGQVGSAGIASNAVTGAKIAMGSDAAGDIIYYNGTDYARLGIGTALQVLRTNAGATAPEWATPVFTKSEYASSALTVSVGTTYTKAHGLAVVPKLVTILLTNTSADVGFSSDVVYWAGAGDTAGANRGLLIRVTSTNVLVTVGSSGIFLPRPDTGDTAQIDLTKWTLTVKAYA